jgi:hypothetical protein
MDHMGKGCRQCLLLLLVTAISWVPKAACSRLVRVRPSRSRKNSRLAFDRQTFESVWDPSYWRKICPRLTISDEEGEASGQEIRQKRSKRAWKIPDLQILKKRLKNDGYYQVNASTLNLSVNSTDLVEGIERLEEFNTNCLKRPRM